MIICKITLDTVLGFLSCLLGVIALFVGGKAYKKCQFFESPINESKQIIVDGTVDKSQHAGQVIINNGPNADYLMNMTTTNFDSCLKRAYDLFEENQKINIRNILDETRKIIREQKPNIA